MGIQDRDYYREGSGGFMDSWGRQGNTVWLIVLTSVFFFVQLLGGSRPASPLVALGAYDYQKVASGEVWRLFTSLFLHATLWHVFVNMLVLYFVGSRLEELYGSREFLAFYLISGVLAQCARFGAQSAGAGEPDGIAIGAGGAVAALLVLFAFYFPMQRIYIWCVLPVPMWLLVMLYVGFGSVAGPEAGEAGFAALLGGALFGAIYYQTGLRLTEFFAGGSRPVRRARPSLRVIPPPELDDTPEPVGAAVESESRPKPKERAEDFESRVDAVLAKVSKYGQESLTPEEREILFKASELYKKKRK